ncbi:hypothetical protein P153DRAFT_217874 [Dothidotthia symphoricarpi CBS 119687]|uniref:Uncharacterized protein n=1 Tax=Dothidotthia symphoricarpi CBS 119687 TaxID=1392245 RepID=A0A6A6AHQ4_9PLEO|nr:uncharacterized protein P153DRAFT_217874 [Dothidotthia symphoricarpi CBS 119687]KAF2130437.1 hypothetical protein P153DRAFT_217874 [Dothidotthia symphoricarpi CBS 119687]
MTLAVFAIAHILASTLIRVCAFYITSCRGSYSWTHKLDRKRAKLLHYISPVQTIQDVIELAMRHQVWMNATFERIDEPTCFSRLSNISQTIQHPRHTHSLSFRNIFQLHSR